MFVRFYLRSNEEDDMHETYRMLGREREADLQREAVRCRLAEAATGRASPRNEETAGVRAVRKLRFARVRLAALLR
jgi:hypothetical protein